jgi:hypothetical protein
MPGLHRRAGSGCPVGLACRSEHTGVLRAAQPYEGCQQRGQDGEQASCGARRVQQGQESGDEGRASVRARLYLRDARIDVAA